MSKIDGFSVVSAAVRKSLAPALVADSIGELAQQSAMNPGCKPKRQALAVLCVTTEKGKTRTPAAGTIGALVLDVLKHIEGTCAAVGVFPESQGGTVGLTLAQRAELAGAYAVTVQGLFTGAVQAAADTRKAATEAAKAAKAAAAVSTPADNADTGAKSADTGETVTGPSVSDLLAELDALRNVADTLASVRAELSRVSADRDALRVELTEAVTERDTLRHAELQRVELESSRITAAAAAAAAVDTIGTADMVPTLAQQRKARKAATAA